MNYNLKLKNFFETRTVKFFEDIKFGGEIRLRNIISKEEFVLIFKQIHKVVTNVANLDP